MLYYTIFARIIYARVEKVASLELHSRGERYWRKSCVVRKKGRQRKRESIMPADSAWLVLRRRRRQEKLEICLDLGSSMGPGHSSFLSFSLSIALFTARPFPRQASVPRDRRNPLPSFRNDDMKRVLMWVQLWGSIPIKTLSLLLLLLLLHPFYRFLPFLRRCAPSSGFSISDLALSLSLSLSLAWRALILIPRATFVRGDNTSRRQHVRQWKSRTRTDSALYTLVAWTRKFLGWKKAVRSYYVQLRDWLRSISRPRRFFNPLMINHIKQALLARWANLRARWRWLRPRR